MTTKTKEEIYREEFEKSDYVRNHWYWKFLNKNFSGEYSDPDTDKLWKGYLLGRKASEAENQNLKRENGILRMSLNKLHSDVSMGEHLDSEWIINTIEQVVTHPVIDASLKMLKVREQTIQQQKELIEKAVVFVEYAVLYSTPLSRKNADEWLEKARGILK